MEQSKLDRINALARKQKTVGLTDAEKAEQQVLRDEYRAAFRRSLTASLDNTVLVDEKGNVIRHLRNSRKKPD
ncbi:MAG: DUF896 domain-containing protein [Oscillospiraceae bacterium]|nr:DUF896 domain-containing protein [Oscillospiraceae bacterium]